MKKTSAFIYGVLWDGTNTQQWSRTDSAIGFADPSAAVNNGTGFSPFDTISPWKDMVIVNDPNAGKVVAIPKFYYKWTRNGRAMKLQISSEYFDGSFVSPAHQDRGDGKGERDIIYVGRYHCADTTYKSESGVKPQTLKTRAEFRSAIHNLGANVWQWDYATLWTIQMLYLVEFANWNSQAKIGYGCGNGSGTQNMGSTDSMKYHTGISASSKTIYNVGIQYRNIEGLWSNVLDFVDGIYFNDADVYCIKNPELFNDNSGGTKVGTRVTSSNCITAYNTPTVSGFEWALYPSEVNSSYGTYISDCCAYDISGAVLLAGSSYYCGQYYGLFYLDGYFDATSNGSVIGSRILVLP